MTYIRHLYSNRLAAACHLGANPLPARFGATFNSNPFLEGIDHVQSFLMMLTPARSREDVAKKIPSFTLLKLQEVTSLSFGMHSGRGAFFYIGFRCIVAQSTPKGGLASLKVPRSTGRCASKDYEVRWSTVFTPPLVIFVQGFTS